MGIWIPGGLKGDSGPEPYVPSTWADGTDEEIVEALEKHYNDEIDLTEYWSVGDERIVNLSAMTKGCSISTSYPVEQSVQTVTYVILNTGGKELVTPINGHTECAFVVGQKNKLSTSSNYVMTIKWSGSSTAYASFRNTFAKTWLDEKYYYAIPETFRTIFKQFKNKGFYIKKYISLNAEYYQGVSGGTTNNVLFSLPTLKEARGTSSVLGEENLTRFEYYTTTANYTNSIKNCYYGSYNATNTTGSTTQKQPYYDKNGTLTEGSGTHGILPFGVI